MRKILLFILLFISVSVAAQTPSTTYKVPSVTNISTYFGNADRLYVVDSNRDYVVCNPCLTDSIVGAGGRKWKKLVTVTAPITFDRGYVGITPADATHAGSVSTGTQIFGGNKTFTGILSNNGMPTSTGGAVLVHGIDSTIRQIPPGTGSKHIHDDGKAYDTTAVGGGTVTGGVINWPGTIYSTPTTGTVSTGTLTFAPALATQTANTVLSGPTSGGAATPTFRALVAADIPALSTYWKTTGNTGVHLPDTSSLWLGTTDLTPLRFKTNGTGRMIIDSVGKVGVGTMTPTALFSVGLSSQFTVSVTGVPTSPQQFLSSTSTVTLGNSGNSFALTINSAEAKIVNNFNLGFLTNATAYLHIKAPTATANTGQIKLASGPPPTTPEDGLINNSSTQGLVFDQGSTRETIGMWGYVAKAVDYTAAIADYTIALTVTGKTVTLPTAVGISGRVYIVKLTVSGTGTVATTSSQTIDGSTTYSLSAQYKYVNVQSDGANWNIIGNN